MPIIGSKKMLKILLKQDETLYKDLERGGTYDYVDIRAKRDEIVISNNTMIVIDSVSATNECLGRISEDVLGLIQELLATNRLVQIMQHLYINDARYPDYDLHREARLYTLDFLSEEEPTYIHIGPDHVIYTHPIYPLIA